MPRKQGTNVNTIKKNNRDFIIATRVPDVSKCVPITPPFTVSLVRSVYAALTYRLHNLSLPRPFFCRLTETDRRHSAVAANGSKHAPLVQKPPASPAIPQTFPSAWLCRGSFRGRTWKSEAPVLVMVIAVCVVCSRPAQAPHAQESRQWQDKRVIK